MYTKKPRKKSIPELLKEIKAIAKISDSEKEKEEKALQNITLLSKDYEDLNTANKILEVYLKLLVSVLPLVETKVKLKPSEFTVRAVTTLGESIRQTINDLEVYKDPTEIMEDKISPIIQRHHDDVIKKIAEYLSRTRTFLIELIPSDKQDKANKLLIEFLTNLGEDLKETYVRTIDNLSIEITSVKGL